MEERNTVSLSDGRMVVLTDEDDIILSLRFKDRTEDTYHLPYPSGGYGGGSLQLSPSEQYLIFSYFSGESEEAFALFQIKNRQLKFRYDSGYLYGESASYTFIKDETTLVQTFRTATWYKEYAETDENGDMYYDFGELNLFDLETCELSRHTVRVYPSDDWIEEETDVGTFALSKVADGQFHLIMPWGKAVFLEPLQNILMIKL